MIDILSLFEFISGFLREMHMLLAILVSLIVIFELIQRRKKEMILI